MTQEELTLEMLKRGRPDTYEATADLKREKATPKTPYVPESKGHREALAFQLEAMLTDSGFQVELVKAGHEKVFARQVTAKDKDGHQRPIPGIRVVVYSTIDGKQVRENGKDAIRVCGVYTNREGATRGLTKDTRINRTGDIEGIVERTLQRMRDAFKNCRIVQRCNKCNAPMFTAKSGKIVCADACWTIQK